MTDNDTTVKNVTLRWCRHPLDQSEDVLIWVDLTKIDFYWKSDRNYVGPRGTGAAIAGRYHMFGKWIMKGEEIEYVSLNRSSEGHIVFSDGRHRTAWLRDHGVVAIPILTESQSTQWLLEKCGSDLRESILPFPKVVDS